MIRESVKNRLVLGAYIGITIGSGLALCIFATIFMQDKITEQLLLGGLWLIFSLMIWSRYTTVDELRSYHLRQQLRLFNCQEALLQRALRTQPNETLQITFLKKEKIDGNRVRKAQWYKTVDGWINMQNGTFWSERAFRTLLKELLGYYNIVESITYDGHRTIFLNELKN